MVVGTVFFGLGGRGGSDLAPAKSGLQFFALYLELPLVRKVTRGLLFGLVLAKPFPVDFLGVVLGAGLRGFRGNSNRDHRKDPVIIGNTQDWA